MDIRKKRRAFGWRLLAAFAALAIAGLMYLRTEAEGLSNALSYRYWQQRISGQDLFSPSEALFKRGNRSYREVCLTFDDGPHPSSCRQILQTLNCYGVRATFFLVGERIRQHPELAKLILDDGDEVGNHTEDHQRLDRLPREQVRRELEDCEREFERATGAKMDLMRPPGMRFNRTDLSIAKELGYITVDWNVGAKDFMGHTDPRTIEARVLDHVRNGSIILLHDCPDTAAALPSILEGLKERGYAVRTVSQMLRRLPNPVTIQTNARIGTGPSSAGFSGSIMGHGQRVPVRQLSSSSPA